MANIVGMVSGAIACIMLIIIIVTNIRSTNILKRLAKRYEDGIEIDCFFLEGLQDRFLKIGISNVDIEEDYIVIKNGKNLFQYYLKNGRVFTDISNEVLKLSKFALLVGTRSKARQLKKAVEYNLMMDKLIATYNIQGVKEETDDYVKAFEYSQSSIRNIAFFSFLVIVSLSVYSSQFVNNLSLKINNSFKKEHIKKISEIKEDKKETNRETEEIDQEKEEIDREIEETNQEIKEEKEGIEEDVKGEEKSNIEEKIDIVKKSKPNEKNFTLEETLEAYFLSPMWKLNNDSVIGNKDRIIFSGIFPERDKENKEVKYTLEFFLDYDEGIIEFGEMYAYGLVEDRILQNLILKAVFERENSVYEVQELLDLLKKDVLNDGIQNDNSMAMVENSEGGGDSGEVDFSSEYVIPDSDTRFLEEEELWELDKETLRIARNEIYARHGRMFESEELQEYFERKSWYAPSIKPEDFDENILSEIEKYNVRLIKKAEK